MRCAVVGAGAWGTALADLLADNGFDTALWAFESDVARSINDTHENRRFLTGLPLCTSLRATTNHRDALCDADLVVYAAPSDHLRRVAAAGAQHVRPDAILAVATKGIERHTLALMTSVIGQEVPNRAVVGISGPSFAAEVVAGHPTAIVAASANLDAAIAVQSALSSSTFRVYTNSDVIGVELGGALKNVMAVATGIVEGVGLGYNSRAALITRGLHEMTRLGVALGADPLTFAGLAGVGDLVLTCTGSLSRNRAIGLEIGRGASLADALAGKETVAEGVPTTASALELAAKHDVDMPIAQMVYRILFEGHVARDAVPELMARELRSEQDL
ncbi:MAG TPA: NAD(P)H-dependent glycerol-3-phosphate dehydrogenase [Gemmatimonadaceae bacterium]|jgi:glycerol-3-phosphate dehydrogenase (NAD(P)+)|nr:NAD(P)H-dependent glycerol-3-phosphate dehydrogenase [Gemmatimonadaceae bacterium]